MRKRFFLPIFALLLISCAPAQDETRFYKITPGMTAARVESLVGKPESVDYETDGTEVWRYPVTQKNLEKGSVVGIVSPRRGPSAAQKAIHDNEMASQNYNSSVRDIAFRDGVVSEIRRKGE